MPASWHGRRIRRGARFKGVIFIMNRFFVGVGVAVLITSLIYTAYSFGAAVKHDRNYSVLNTKAKRDIRILGSFLALYELDHGNYPDSLEALVGDYLDQIVKDPWGNDFGYISDGSKAIIFTNGSADRAKQQIFHVETKKI